MFYLKRGCFIGPQYQLFQLKRGCFFLSKIRERFGFSNLGMSMVYAVVRSGGVGDGDGIASKIWVNIGSGDGISLTVPSYYLNYLIEPIQMCLMKTMATW